MKMNNRSAPLFLIVGVACLAAVGVQGYQDDGTRVAELWPPVVFMNSTSGVHSSVALVLPCKFEFIDESGPSSQVSQAIQLYKPLILGQPGGCDKQEEADPEDQILTGIEITAEHPVPGKAPQQETYTLSVPAGGHASLVATSYEGVLRGLETFSQLVLNSSITPNGQKQLHVADLPLQVEDEPSFPHRGLLIDVARTFLPVDNIKKTIDGLMYSKMNVLHIHISDSQAFPLELKSNPEITQHGAQAADMVYTQADIQGIVAYAAKRGVRVYPEVSKKA